MIQRPTTQPDTTIVPNVSTTESQSGLIVLNEPVGTAEASGINMTSIDQSGCIPGQVEWISPSPGEEISGDYELMGTVNVQDMAFFRYAYAPLSDTTSWSEIAVGSLPVIEGTLGIWATSQTTNGDYVLRIVVVDKTNLEMAPCEVAIRVLNGE